MRGVAVRGLPAAKSQLRGALIAGVLAALFVALTFRFVDESVRLEVGVESSAAGQAQLFYAGDDNFSEQNSATVSFEPGARLLEFELPGAEYRHLRLDPSNTDQPLRITSLEVVSADGTRTSLD